MFRKQLMTSICFISICILGGCANLSIPFFGKSSKEAKTSAKSDLDKLQNLELNEFVHKGRVVNAQRLERGRNIAFFPFKAGEGVEATDELDSVALTIIKGVADAFADDKNGKHAHFNILTADDSRSPDLIVKGHVTRMGKPSKLGRWLLFKKTKSLSVEGKIMDAQTGEAVLIFHDRAGISGQSQDYRMLGQRIGKNIGRYILSGID